MDCLGETGAGRGNDSRAGQVTGHRHTGGGHRSKEEEQPATELPLLMLHTSANVQ